MNYFLLRRFLSLVPVFSLGLFLVGYLWLHSKPLGPGGGEAYDAALKNFGNIPFGALAVWLFVFLPLIPYFFHLLFSVTPKALPLRVWVWPISGILGLLFLAYHFFLQAQVSSDYEGFLRIFKNPLNGAFYFLGLSFLVFHFTESIWHAFVQWGIALSEKSRSFFRHSSLSLFLVMATANGLIVANDTFREVAPAWIAGLLNFVRDFLFL
ncbi:MAG: hypothetical protein Q7T11_01780 [Deltaproteobacteria bacterium]|nr:hypothetical protein [Deltaproteobacteria bacterium]